MNGLHILIVDDEGKVRKMIRRYFKRKPHIFYEASCDMEAYSILAESNIDIAILDIKLSGTDGLDILKHIKQEYESIEVIMITGFAEEDSILKAMRYGAFDFFHKPLNLYEIQSAIERTTRFINMQNKLNGIKNKYDLLHNEFTDNFNFDIIATSVHMKSVFEQAMKAAETPDTAILITGASGVGKELIARAIHYASNRKHNYFYPLNCSAIPETLIESELFGHKKGAFTGALEDKKGCFEAANGGTLFLDEIGDMPIQAQTKLLRILDDSKVRKIGSNKEFDVDVRIISATNRNISKMVEENKFRLDLFYRLNTFEINIPPLKERPEDIPKLVEYFVSSFSKRLSKPIKSIDNAIFSALKKYSFPGNVRELKNLIERAIILCDNNVLTLGQFHLMESKKILNEKNSTQTSEIFDLSEIEKTTIQKALDKTNHNITHASKLLNITRQSLLRRIKKYNL